MIMRDVKMGCNKGGGGRVASFRRWGYMDVS